MNETFFGFGNSFHVGSGAQNPEAYADAMTDAYNLFHIGLQCGHQMSVLDIGGGYPGDSSENISFEQVTHIS